MKTRVLELWWQATLASHEEAEARKLDEQRRKETCQCDECVAERQSEEEARKRRRREEQRQADLERQIEESNDYDYDD